jgi:hypothetical protein
MTQAAWNWQAMVEFYKRLGFTLEQASKLAEQMVY